MREEELRIRELERDVRQLQESLKELIALVELDEENKPGTDLYTAILVAKESLKYTEVPS